MLGLLVRGETSVMTCPNPYPCACSSRVICFDCWQGGKRVPGFGLIPRVTRVGGKLVPVEMKEKI